MFNNIKDIKDLDKYLINDDFTYRHYAIGSPNNNDIFPYSKIIWGCGICEHDKKVQMKVVMYCLVLIHLLMILIIMLKLQKKCLILHGLI